MNEADFTALHGAAFRGLNEVVAYLAANGADIDARDFRGRTPYRMAEGSKQSFQFQSWPETAALLAELGADTKLGIAGTVQETPARPAVHRRRRPALMPVHPDGSSRRRPSIRELTGERRSSIDPLTGAAPPASPTTRSRRT